MIGLFRNQNRTCLSYGCKCEEVSLYSLEKCVICRLPISESKRVEIFHGYRNYQCKPESKKEEKMSYNTVENVNFRNGKGDSTPFRVVSVKFGRIIQDTMSETFDDAISKAERLAETHPGEEFQVFGPLASVKSDIPLKKTNLIQSLFEKMKF